ncbi:MAG: glycosyltransferase, partial [Candidatus Lokiarchaeota archaeon]|nr:glycosyltransferase [Candidatus Lokiarchaeota archaeon]
MMKKSVWIFSFEFSGIIKEGGLGEVPANQTKWLANQYDITLFMPSHNIHKNKEKVDNLQLTKANLLYKDRIDIAKFGLGENDEEIAISFYEGTLNNIDVVIIAGENEFASKILNDPVIYGPETLEGKFILFARAMKFYIQNLIEQNQDKIPDIIHCHDHHAIPAMINVRQQTSKTGKDVATVFTIHLLTWPRKNYDFMEACGIEDIPLDIYLSNLHKYMSIKDLYELLRARNINVPSIEEIGVLFSDVVTSVSESYLKNNVVKQLGGSLIAGKSEFFWNGCDWDYDDMLRTTKVDFKEDLMKFNPNDPFSRTTIRNYLETKALGELPRREPVNSSSKIKDFLSNKLIKYPYKPNEDGVFAGKVWEFNEPGPLVMMTGRLTKMKGIDTLLNAVPLVLKKHPNTKFLIYVIPSEFSMGEIEPLLDVAYNYKENVRILFGKVFSLFFPTHIAADLFCAPSRWEPFGIIALEAMVSRVPVVASRVGGLQESVLDLREHPNEGTGLLVPVDQHQKLAESLINLLSIMEIDELAGKSNIQNNKESFNENNIDLNILEELKSNITFDDLRKKVDTNLQFGSEVRENCGNRVENVFRWKIVSQK